MLRLLSIATLLMIALCIVISASIALAADPAPAVQPALGQEIGGQAIGGEDIYEFDFAIEVETTPNPEISAPNDIQDI